MAAPPKALYFTTDDEANRLLAEDPFALLVGFALDQQVTVPTAFAGPLKIKQRIGTLDPKTLAQTDLEPAFREKPAVHRFPGSMAQRVQDLAQHVVDEYGGDAGRIWGEAKDAADLRKRLGALPGYGEMKIKSMGAVLSKRFGVRVAEPLAPSHPTLGDVDSPEALAAYQAAKRAYKASLRSGTPHAWSSTS
jgi:uncharacterized HhH-GPD family protein